MEGQVRGSFAKRPVFKSGYHKRVNRKNDHDDTHEDREGSSNDQDPSEDRTQDQIESESQNEPEKMVFRRPMIEAFPIDQVLHKKELLRRKQFLEDQSSLSKKTISHLALFRIANQFVSTYRYRKYRETMLVQHELFRHHG